MSAKPTTKTFGKSTRVVPATADKAQKWYNADDETDPKKVSLTIRPTIGRLDVPAGQC